MNYNKFLINQDKSIIDALAYLNDILRHVEISRLILFVTDNENKVIGSITDGDIRRSIIKDHNLKKKLIEVCNKNFSFEYEKEEFIDLSVYRKKKIKVLPLLDNNNILSGIIDLDKIISKLPMECVIMAGGRGKRMSPLTDKIPKPMLPLGNKPIIEHNIDRLIKFGIKKVYISLGYLGNQIRDYFGDGSSKGIQIEYLLEEKPLGTAGSLKLIKNISTKYLLVMNADLFTNADFEKMYINCIKNNSEMVISTKEYKIDIPYGIIENKGKNILSLKEKPSYYYKSNAGIYILDKENIKLVPENSFFDITDLIKIMLEKKSKITFTRIYGYWIDIGSPSQYESAKNLIKTINL